MKIFSQLKKNRGQYIYIFLNHLFIIQPIKEGMSKKVLVLIQILNWHKIQTSKPWELNKSLKSKI